MGVFKNDVGRPTNETIKKRRILKAILALLVAGALFTGGYYVNEFINKYDVNKEKENENSVSKKQAEKLISIVSQVNINSAKFGYFYKQDRNIDNLDNDVILISAISKLITDDKRTFTKNEVNKTVKKIFGDIEYKDESVSSYCYEFNYDASKELYTDNSGCSGDGPSIYSEIINVETSSDKLTIIDKIAVSDFNYDSGILTLYKDLNRSIVIKENYNLDEGIKEYLDILDSYKWTFIKDSNGDYLFESVEKIARQELPNDDLNKLAQEVYDYYSDFIYAPPLNEFYSENGALQNDLPQDYMITIATSNLKERKCNGKYNKFMDEKDAENEMCYDEKQIIDMVDKLFGVKVEFNSDSVIEVGCDLYNYSSANEEFYLAGGLGTTELYIKNMYDYKLENDKLSIYEVVAIKALGPEKVIYLSTSGKEIQLNESLTKENIVDNKDLFDKFKWNFIKNSEGNYIFESVEKIK